VLLPTIEIDHQQVPACFEFIGRCCHSLAFEVIGQVVYHESAQDNIEQLIGEDESYNINATRSVNHV
jgi:hypothetical protein